MEERMRKDAEGTVNDTPGTPQGLHTPKFSGVFVQPEGGIRVPTNVKSGFPYVAGA
jgi:hypothetical protein